MILAILIDFLGASEKKKRAQWEKLSDQELIVRYQTSEELLLVSVLMDRYQDLIVARTLNYLREEEAVRDLISALYLKLAEKLRHAGEIRDFKAWLRRLITNTMIDQSRRNQRFEAYISTLTEEVEEIEHQLALQVDSEQLSIALEQLHPLPRLYVIQHFFMGKQNAEIAEEQQLDPNQVRGARSRALKKLGECLGDSFADYLS